MMIEFSFRSPFVGSFNPVPAGMMTSGPALNQSNAAVAKPMKANRNHGFNR